MHGCLHVCLLSSLGPQCIFVYCLSSLLCSCLALFSGSPVLLLEYAALGDLLGVLRKRRGASDRVKRQLLKLDSIVCDGEENIKDLAKVFSTKTPGAFRTMPNKDDLLRADNVFAFGRQIARGMEFLTSKHVSYTTVTNGY